MLADEILVMAWLTMLGNSVVSLIRLPATSLRWPAMWVTPLVGLVTSGLLAALLTVAGVPRVLWWLLASGALIGAAALADAWRCGRVRLWIGNAAGAVVTGVAGIVLLFASIGPVMSFDSYRLVLVGRSWRAGRFDLSTGTPSSYPFLVTHLQGVARGLRGEYTVYAASVAACMALIGALVIAAQTIPTHSTRRRMVLAGTATLVVVVLSTYMLRLQLVYLNSHLVASALYATTIASVVWCASNKSRRPVLLLVGLCLAGYTIVRLEGLLVVTLLIVFAVGAIDLSRREATEMGVLALAAPTVWYGSIALQGGSSDTDILSPSKLMVSLAMPSLALGTMALPRRHPIRRLVDGRLAVTVLLIGVTFQTLVNRPDAVVSIASQVRNTFVDGGWGVFWWAVAALAVVRVTLSLPTQPTDGATPAGGAVSELVAGALVVRWVTVTVGYALLVTLLGTVRFVPYRVGWGDSGNRMFVHFAPAIVISFVLWASRIVVVADDRRCHEPQPDGLRGLESKVGHAV